MTSALRMRLRCQSPSIKPVAAVRCAAAKRRECACSAASSSDRGPARRPMQRAAFAEIRERRCRRFKALVRPLHSRSILLRSRTPPQAPVISLLCGRSRSVMRRSHPRSLAAAHSGQKWSGFPRPRILSSCPIRPNGLFSVQRKPRRRTSARPQSPRRLHEAKRDTRRSALVDLLLGHADAEHGVFAERRRGSRSSVSGGRSRPRRTWRWRSRQAEHGGAGGADLEHTSAIDGLFLLSDGASRLSHLAYAIM